MSPWTDFYDSRIASPQYLNYCAIKYRPFIEEVSKRVKNGDRVVEIGCGLATITRLLHTSFMAQRLKGGGMVGFHCYDKDPEMVHLARCGADFPVDLCDAELPTGCKPDIIHSHGLLEHLTDTAIRDIIAANRIDGARTAVHYVPSYKYEKPSFGDERLLTPNQWMAIAKPTNIVPFNEGYDLALIWEFD